MKSGSRIIATGIFAAALAGGAGLALAQAQKGAGEKVGERLDDAGRAIKRGVQDLSSDVRQGFAKAKNAVHNMGVESRVYARLHWDKTLTDAEIELDADREGVVTLRGSVADAAAKQKALTLARDTQGVTRVVDNLTVGASTTTETRTTTTIEKTERKPAPRP